MRLTTRSILAAAGAALLLLLLVAAAVWLWWPYSSARSPYRYVDTIAGLTGDLGEPFGIAVKGREIYFSDGVTGKIMRFDGAAYAAYAAGLDTPSAISFTKNGDLIVADPGTNSIRLVNTKREISVIAGAAGLRGSEDGSSAKATFNGPTGVVAAADGRIFVADTYNDRIRVIAGDTVSTVAGSVRGFADGTGNAARFDTPTGLAVWKDKLLVADLGNRRIRVVEPDGRVWTLAGNGDAEVRDGLLPGSAFVQPSAVAVDKDGSIFIADGNAVRQISGDLVPIVRTISATGRGLGDGAAGRSRFNRPSGLAVDDRGNLIVADSENRLVRRFTPERSGHAITAAEIAGLTDKPEEFRKRQPPRWPYDPPTASRDIAGTLGEIRGEIPETDEPARFHNGLDIAGAYGETARFVRDEKVLRPLSTENFGTLRELLRLPEIGYIHIRLGRNASSVPFGDKRFLFDRDADGRLVDVRIPRGAKFTAGEPIGTLNAMNHVHLIAGRSGAEMNALDALTLPNLTDTRMPTIEKVSFFDENWREIETAGANTRIKLAAKVNVVVRAYDQADGNSDRRRLGLFRLGYQILRADGGIAKETKWTIVFDRFPPAGAVPFVYAAGSHSGATGETIFNYIVTNFMHGDEFHGDFLDTGGLAGGNYTLRVFAADYFGNTAQKDTAVEVLK